MEFSLICDIPYAERPVRGCFDLYLPDGADEDTPFLIYFYGGSLKKGSKDRQRLPAALAASGIAVAVPDYRLIPDVTYPSFIDDSADAVAKILSPEVRGKLTPRFRRIFVGGHSAGAYLSMMLFFDGKYLRAREVDLSLLSGFLFISGCPVKHMSISACEGIDPRRVLVDETSAIYHIGTPDPLSPLPLLIATSDCDMANRREQNYLLRGTLAHFAYPAPIAFVDFIGVTHGGMCRPDAESGDIPILPHILDFVGLQHDGKQ